MLLLFPVNRCVYVYIYGRFQPPWPKTSSYYVTGIIIGAVSAVVSSCSHMSLLDHAHTQEGIHTCADELATKFGYILLADSGKAQIVYGCDTRCTLHS